jgi:hypothetical protein
MRAGGKSLVSEALMKFFSLVCLKFNICFISCHIPGILNVYADRLSRDVSMQEFPTIIADTKENLWWKGQSAEVISRNFLHKCMCSHGRLTRAIYSSYWKLCSEGMGEVLRNSGS